MAVDITATTQEIVVGNTNIPNDSDMTLIAVAHLDTLASNRYLISNTSKGNAPNSKGWAFGFNASGAPVFVKLGVTALAASITFSAGGIVAVTCKVDVDTDVKFGILELPTDSAFATSTSINTSAIASSAGGRQTHLGNLKDLDLGMDGRLYSAAVYNGLVADADIERIARAMIVGRYGQAGHSLLAGLWVPNSTDATGVFDWSGNGNDSTSNDTNAIADHFGGPWFGFDEDLTFVLAAAGGAAVMNQLQGANLGADLYNGTLM